MQRVMEIPDMEVRDCLQRLQAHVTPVHARTQIQQP